MRARDVRVRESEPARGYFWGTVFTIMFVAVLAIILVGLFLR